MRRSREGTCSHTRRSWDSSIGSRGTCARLYLNVLCSVDGPILSYWNTYSLLNIVCHLLHAFNWTTCARIDLTRRSVTGYWYALILSLVRRFWNITNLLCRNHNRLRWRCSHDSWCYDRHYRWRCWNWCNGIGRNSRLEATTT